ncbi:hypothetical protein TRIP_C21299 [Candidatus Zixiibacteriota bacterium]|nr:hypothetical protein TRIP_C21299 [candidate division Zixibacteria bacterium]
MRLDVRRRRQKGTQNIDLIISPPDTIAGLPEAVLHVAGKAYSNFLASSILGRIDQDTSNIKMNH